MLPDFFYSDTIIKWQEGKRDCGMFKYKLNLFMSNMLDIDFCGRVFGWMGVLKMSNILDICQWYFRFRNKLWEGYKVRDGSQMDQGGFCFV